MASSGMLRHVALVRTNVLPSLDLDIYRRPDGSLGHKVYRKPTHTNLYLNTKSHHHPSNKQAVLSALIHRARALCDEDSLQAELVFLRDVFKQNGYNDRQLNALIKNAIHQGCHPRKKYKLSRQTRKP
jgi:hypothetical protein